MNPTGPSRKASSFFYFLWVLLSLGPVIFFEFGVVWFSLLDAGAVGYLLNVSLILLFYEIIFQLVMIIIKRTLKFQHPNLIVCSIAVIISLLPVPFAIQRYNKIISDAEKSRAEVTQAYCNSYGSDNKIIESSNIKKIANYLVYTDDDISFQLSNDYSFGTEQISGSVSTYNDNSTIEIIKTLSLNNKNILFYFDWMKVTGSSFLSSTDYPTSSIGRTYFKSYRYNENYLYVSLSPDKFDEYNYLLVRVDNYCGKNNDKTITNNVLTDLKQSFQVK